MMRQKNIKLLLIIGVPLLLILFLVYWVSTQSYLRIETQGGTHEEATYKIVNQETGRSETMNNQPDGVTKRVPKGSYEVLVTRGESSFYKVVSTKGFFNTTTVSSALEGEASRAFVGNNPGPCMFYGEEILYSYACSAGYEELNVHKPATTMNPTVTTTTKEDVFGMLINGMVSLGGKNSILISRENQHGSGSSTQPELFSVSTQPTLSNPIKLKDIDGSSTLQIRTFSEGFIAYDTDFKTINYYPNPSATPSAVPNNKPKGDDMSALDVSTTANLIGISYTEKKILEEHYDTISENESEEQESDVKKVGKSTLNTFDTKTQSSNTYTFGQSFGYLELCGEQRACGLLGKQLSVYDISNKKPKRLFIVGDVTEFISSGNGVVATRSDGTLLLNTKDGSGKIDYSLGGYTLCGIQPVTNRSYALCTIDLNGNRRALLLESNRSNTDSIDKKIINLSLLTDVISDISIYRNIIYISPNLGERVYNTETNTYGYDPNRQKETATKLNSLIQESGINPSTYTVINLYP